MARAPLVTRDTIPEPYRAAFDEVFAIISGSGMPTNGPSFILLNCPELARRGAHFADYLRQESTLSRKIIELAMLTTARGTDCPFIWDTHAPSARRLGISAAALEGLREDKPLPPMPPDEIAVINYGLEFFRTRQVSDATFQAAMAQFGVGGLVELTALMGYYALLAFIGNAFQLESPASPDEPSPPV